MDKSILIVGVVLIGAGAFLFFVGQTIVDNAWQAIPNYQQEVNRGNMIKAPGVVVLIIGFIVTVIGVVTIEKKKRLSNDVKCQICGIPKGDKHFYVVNDKDRKLTVCDRCVEQFRKEKELKHKEVGQTAYNEPLNIVKTRYAKGEITQEQYLQMKKDLER